MCYFEKNHEMFPCDKLHWEGDGQVKCIFCQDAQSEMVSLEMRDVCQSHWNLGETVMLEK